MNPIARSAALAASTVFGALMVGLAAFGSHGAPIVAGVAAAVAVGAGVAFRPAATVAVLLTVATILASDPSPVFAAWSGLCAVAYLVCRHAVGVPAGVVIWSWPTAVAAVGFSCAGLVATLFPLQVPWLPLAAPLGALALYVLATRPFVS
ncbi:hypothetical protein A5672_20095 [Mycobacterium alsense]|uniref:Integral membrane protein n=1 Tax=Mycobacterium alsense TaxID=324058 RepID=A0ABD6P1T2_9MYCO|nr:hypothetical protein [Mycobacterium alsense]OBG36358.1 hypothetical protein A5672_20095 [Mycobacterium alsense]